MVQNPKKTSSSSTTLNKTSTPPVRVKDTSPSQKADPTTSSESPVRTTITHSTDAVTKAVKDAEKFLKTSTLASQLINDASYTTTENLESFLAYSNTTLKTAEYLMSQSVEYINDLFADNMDISKKFFDCKTATDIIEWQSDIFRKNTTSYINETAKITNTLVEYSNTITTPFLERSMATFGTFLRACS